MMSERNIPPFFKYCDKELFLDTFLAFKKSQGKERYTHKYHDRYTTIKAFEENLTDEQKLIQDYLESDTYRFSPLFPFFLPKENSNAYRMICVPSIRDRLVQRMLIGYLKKHYGENLKVLRAADFSIEGEGAKAARDKALEYRKIKKFALKTDISSFFDNLDRTELLKLLMEKVNASSLEQLFKSLINCDPFLPGDYSPDDKAFIFKKMGKGVRQGMPLSPLLASFYLSNFDAFLKTQGILYVRYADDLIFFLDSSSECIEVYQIIKQKLLDIQLSLPPLDQQGKSQIIAEYATVTFLGLELRYENKQYNWYIPQRTILKVCERLTKLTNIKINIHKKMTFQQTLKRMNQITTGYLYCFKDAESKNIAHFKKQLEFEKSKAISKILKDLGIDIEKLPQNHRNYLIGTLKT